MPFLRVWPEDLSLHLEGFLKDPLQPLQRGFRARTGEVVTVYAHGQVAALVPEVLGAVAAYLEAFRAGVPVISGRDGGVSDIVIDGENGLAVPTEDAAALAQAIITLVTDTELSKRLVAGGAQTLAERTAVRLIDETLRVYDEVTVSSSEASMHSAPPASASHAEPVASSRTPKKRRPIAFAENVRS